MGLGIRGWRRVGLGICKVGGVGSRYNHAPWILCSAVRTISTDRLVFDIQGERFKSMQSALYSSLGPAQVTLRVRDVVHT